MRPSVLLVAGDPSGDHHAARLLRELRSRRPELDCWGYGGQELAAAGLRLAGDLVSLSAIGLVDVLPNYRRGRRLLDEALATVTARPPQLAVLVDCGAFNLRLAPLLRRLGVPVLGYIPPGCWSGSRRRAAAVAACYDAVATPFPQPLAAYAELGLPARLVGHPLAEEYADLPPLPPTFDGPPTLALLPGSRRQELLHLLSPLLRSAAALQRELPGLRVVVSRAPSAPRELFDRQLAAAGVAVEVVAGACAALRGATAAIVKSGTVTLEALLLGVPAVAVYRASWLAVAVGALYYWPRPKYWAMPNLLADDLVMPQFFQHQVTPARLLPVLRPWLADTPQRAAQVARLAQTAQLLGGGQPTAETADLALALLDRRPLPVP
ncbi:MAG: hypothetical protein IT204_15750 [Fimbriimonadaceae bacterium]|nr:hypothetical protein [Fimbriimonadaceae bacterium]